MRETEEVDVVLAGILLLVAIAIEVVATALLPRSQGFTNPGWTGAVLLAYGVSIFLLTIVVRTLPVSVAYAIWSGLGTAAVAVIGVLFLNEHLDWVKAVSLAMIVAGVVGLNLTGAH
jgi:small multidrug resistance pump